MRFLTRLHAAVAATVVVILYFSWRQSPSHIQDSFQKVWKGTAHRVVVFGDDWSDTGRYRVAAPPQSNTRDRDPFQGELWVEALCEELRCDFVDNFARSIPSNVSMKTIGAVVDSRIFANAANSGRDETLMLFDFQTQVQQFITAEKEKPQIPAQLRKIDEWTIFTVFFGIWDLLEYSTLEQDAAVHAIDRSVEELVHNLDLLVEHVGGPIQVIIPRLVDVTFLPRYSSRKNESATIFAQKQHQTVFLWTYWNMVLSQATKDWGNGDIFIPDLHGIVMNQVRAKQLYSKQISDAAGLGKQKPLFDEVEQPCLALQANGSAADLQAAHVERCSEPAHYLFWDDMHLSGPAHHLIGVDAARLVRSNNPANAEARQRARLQGSDHKNQGKQGPDFNLKFPPGY